MFRGFLICPFVVELARLDPAGIEAVDPPGPATKGYDTLYDEPALEGAADAGVPIRRELDPNIRLPAQIDDKAFEGLAMVEAGNVPDSDIELTLHFADLEAQGLVGADGMAAIRAGDRLVSISREDGTVVMTPREPVYVTEARPEGFALALANPHRNLLCLKLAPRPKGERARGTT